MRSLIQALTPPAVTLHWLFQSSIDLCRAVSPLFILIAHVRKIFKNIHCIYFYVCHSYVRNIFPHFANKSISSYFDIETIIQNCKVTSKAFANMTNYQYCTNIYCCMGENKCKQIKIFSFLRSIRSVLLSQLTWCLYRFLLSSGRKKNKHIISRSINTHKHLLF